MSKNFTKNCWTSACVTVSYVVEKRDHAWEYWVAPYIMYLDRAFRKMTPFSDSFPKRAEFLFCILLMLSFQFFLFQLYRTMIFLLLLLPSLRRASALQVPNFLGRNYFPLVSSIQR